MICATFTHFVSKYRVFFVRIFPYSDQKNSVFVHFSPNDGERDIKMGRSNFVTFFKSYF